MKLGDRLKERREEKGLTQEQLGALIYVKDATINRYEKNNRKPDLEIIAKLAKILNCTTDYLIGVTDTPNPHLQPEFSAAEGKAVELDRIIENAVERQLKKRGLIE